MRTTVCEIFGIEFPISAFSHCRDVVAAVSRALFLGAVAYSPSVTRSADDSAGGLRSGEVGALIPDEHMAFVRDLLHACAFNSSNASIAVTKR